MSKIQCFNRCDIYLPVFIFFNYTRENMNSSTLELYELAESELLSPIFRLKNWQYLNKNLFHLLDTVSESFISDIFTFLIKLLILQYVCLCVCIYLYKRMHIHPRSLGFHSMRVKFRNLYYITWNLEGRRRNTVRNSVFNSVNSVSSSSIRVFRLCTRSLNSRASACTCTARSGFGICVWLPRRAEVVVTVCFVESIPRNHLVPTMICQATILLLLVP